MRNLIMRFFPLILSLIAISTFMSSLRSEAGPKRVLPPSLLTTCKIALAVGVDSRVPKIGSHVGTLAGALKQHGIILSKEERKLLREARKLAPTTIDPVYIGLTHFSRYTAQGYRANGDADARTQFESVLREFVVGFIESTLTSKPYEEAYRPLAKKRLNNKAKRDRLTALQNQFKGEFGHKTLRQLQDGFTIPWVLAGDRISLDIKPPTHADAMKTVIEWLGNEDVADASLKRIIDIFRLASWMSSITQVPNIRDELIYTPEEIAGVMQHLPRETQVEWAKGLSEAALDSSPFLGRMLEKLAFVSAYEHASPQTREKIAVIIKEIDSRRPSYFDRIDQADAESVD